MAETKSQNSLQSKKESRSKSHYVRFATYKVDPSFRKLDTNVRLQAKEGMFSVMDMFRERMNLVYSLIGTRADADFMIWQVAENLEVFEEFASALVRSSFGPYLKMVHSFLSSTRYPAGLEGWDPQHPQGPAQIRPVHQKQFICMYPVVMTKAWYELTASERYKLIHECILADRKDTSVRMAITYSLGLDDQEFVVVYEADDLEAFGKLSGEIRESKISQYILRDSPTITGVLRDPKWVLDALG